MELRPIQAALLTGRAASRRATATPSPVSYPLAPSFYRYFSSTRTSFSEAEAGAPPPPPSMQEWNQQQQQQQQQPRTWASPAGNNTLNSYSGGFTSIRPNQSSTSSSPSPLPTTPGRSDGSFRSPWAEPVSTTLKRTQAIRAATEGKNKPGILEELASGMSPDANDLTSVLGPTESVSDIKYRLRPSVGRTVHLDNKVDLARGLALLNARVRTNRVQSDVVKQRFHERPGLKRKRLRSERWRARFKDGFKATCSRVQELARQGW